MSRTYKANEPGIAAIVSATFPTRRDVVVSEFRGPKNVNSYWDGGSKDEYKLYDLATGKVFPVPTSHPYFDHKQNGERCGNLELSELPPNCVLVCGGFFCGKPSTVRLLFNPANLTQLLPDKTATPLSMNVSKALNIIGGIKGGARPEYFAQSNLGRYGADNPAVVELIALGYVKANKAGAITLTTEGKNAR